MLSQAFNETQSKLSYFILGATGAGIGFAVQKLDGATFDWAGTVLLAATCFWLISLTVGLQALRCEVRGRKQNVYLQQIIEDNFPDQPADPEEKSKLRAKQDEAIDSAYWWAGVWTSIQLYMLVIGGVLLLGWRVLEMKQRTGVDVVG